MGIVSNRKFLSEIIDINRTHNFFSFPIVIDIAKRYSSMFDIDYRVID